jgi:hypothetical protein
MIYTYLDAALALSLATICISLLNPVKLSIVRERELPQESATNKLHDQTFNGTIRPKYAITVIC